MKYVAGLTFCGLLLSIACMGCGPSTVGTDARPTATSAASSDKAGGKVMEFAIEGMTCEGCVMSLTAKLKKVPGIQSVDISLDDKKAVIRADESQASPEKIEAAIDDAGYQGKLLAAAPAGQ